MKLICHPFSGVCRARESRICFVRVSGLLHVKARPASAKCVKMVNKFLLQLLLNAPQLRQQIMADGPRVSNDCGIVQVGARPDNPDVGQFLFLACF